jgi:hypothetical protein
VDALNLGKLSVGAPYFNAVFVPLMVPVVFLMVPGGVAHWREARWAELAHAMRWPALAAVLVGLGVLFFSTRGTWLTAMGMALATWVVAGLLHQIVNRMQKPGRIPPSFWGMHLAHLGIAVVVVGITLVKGYEVERDVRMGVGDTVQIENYSFELMGVSEVNGPNYKALRGEVRVNKDEKLLEVLYPEKRRYFSSNMPMTEAAIDSGFFRDLYVSLGEPIEGERPQWSERACLLQAVCVLALVRIHLDGLGWFVGGQRPSLPQVPSGCCRLRGEAWHEKVFDSPGAVLGLGGFSGGWLDPQPAGNSFALGGQASACICLADFGPQRGLIWAARHAGPSLDAQRVGHLVCGLQGRTPLVGGLLKSQPIAHCGLELQRNSKPRHALGRQAVTRRQIATGA